MQSAKHLRVVLGRLSERVCLTAVQGWSTQVNLTPLKRGVGLVVANNWVGRYDMQCWHNANKHPPKLTIGHRLCELCQE